MKRWRESVTIGDESVQESQSMDTVIVGAMLLFPCVTKVGCYDLSSLLTQYHLPLSLEQAVRSSQWLAMQCNLFKFDIGAGEGNGPMPTLTTLSEYHPLNEGQIRHTLPEDVGKHCQFIIKFITGSTNADLLTLMPSIENSTQDIKEHNREEQLDAKKRFIQSSLITILTAEMQQSGRGRRDKLWVSPLAVNLYYSIRLEFPLSKIEMLQSISIRAGLILLDILHNMGLENLKLKWPNDIWYRAQKLAGILVETKITPQSIIVVIGIGINNYKSFTNYVISTNKPTSCEAILGTPIDRNSLVASLTTAFYRLWQVICKSDYPLRDIISLWPDKSYFYGKRVTLWQGETYCGTGIEIGIDQTGALLIQTDRGVERITSSTYSMRGESDL